MNWVDIHVAQVPTGIGQTVAWDFTDILTEVGNGRWLILPDQAKNIVVTLTFENGASGLVQDTSERTEVIKFGDPVANDWDAGIVNKKFRDSAKAPSAIRAVMITPGIMRLMLSAR